MTNEDLPQRLQVLLDKQEIYEALMRYCRGVDRRDGDAVASSYHPDAVDDRRSRIRGEDMAAGIEHSDPKQLMSSHFIGNVLIDVDGDTARSEAYCIAHLTLEPADGVIDLGGVFRAEESPARQYYRFVGLRYLDRWERRDGAWKVAHRVCVDDWHSLAPAPDPELPCLHGRRGQRSHADPLYAFMAGRAIPEATAH
jgi:hypothetical protein